jgi:hypothetical protein
VLALLVVAPRPPPQNGSAGPIDDHFEFFGSHAMFQVGGKRWDEWSRAREAAVVARQRAAGDETGSWDPPPDGAGSQGGRIDATALNALCLEVYYRYDKLLVGR